MSLNKKHKDTVFSALFSNKAALLEFYNAYTGAHYTRETANIKINTLSNALYNGLKNDVSFTINGKLVVLIEHQSTINANMPFRMLLYVSRIYERLTKRKDTYRKPLKTPFVTQFHRFEFLETTANYSNLHKKTQFAHVAW